MALGGSLGPAQLGQVQPVTLPSLTTKLTPNRGEKFEAGRAQDFPWIWASRGGGLLEPRGGLGK